MWLEDCSCLLREHPERLAKVFDYLIVPLRADTRFFLIIYALLFL